MGEGANRNKRCRCGSGKKLKNCNCKLSILDRAFPNGRMVDMGNGAFFHVLGMYNGDQYKEFNDFEEKKYAPLYSPEQIRRIMTPHNASDVLLKKQADSIVENMRVQRVFYNRYNRMNVWDYENIIDDSIFTTFKEFIAHNEVYDVIKDIPCGMTYDSDPNGQCIKTLYGNIITISAILKEFLYYMDLFYLGIQYKEIPNDVTSHSLILAIRIMLQNEALDFELDPRGEIPMSINRVITDSTIGEMQFVIAHEYSHSILKHLDSRNVVESADNYVYYNQSQLQEFEADINAIRIMKLFMTEEDAVTHAINFFMSMDVYEQAKEQIAPSTTIIKTHPDAIARIKNILDTYPVDSIDINNVLSKNAVIKKNLMDLISTQFDLFEFYGSIYLGQWHKKKKVDRIDY